MTTVKNYLSNITPEQQKQYERVRKIVEKLAPEAEESISYGVLTFKLSGRPLLYFGAFAKHVSLYPASDRMIAKIGPELEKHRTSKGTLQFSGAGTLTDSLIKKIVTFRLDNFNKL